MSQQITPFALYIHYMFLNTNTYTDRYFIIYFYVTDSKTKKSISPFVALKNPPLSHPGYSFEVCGRHLNWTVELVVLENGSLDRQIAARTPMYDPAVRLGYSWREISSTLLSRHREAPKEDPGLGMLLVERSRSDLPRHRKDGSIRVPPDSQSTNGAKWS